jgi:TonB family protein
MVRSQALRGLRAFLGALFICAPTIGYAASGSEGEPSTRIPTLLGSAFPGWKRVPNAIDMARAAPPDAMRNGISGTTILFCTVTARGILNDCVVDSEEHPGKGFGEAALSLTPKFQMQPTKPDGSSVSGETVRFPVRFVAPR